MRAILRVSLEPASVAALKILAKKVAASKDQKATVRRLWRQKSSIAFADVRNKLETMASGRSRCMYCEDSLGTDIEHFYPKARYPRRAFLWSNYLLACSHCNSNCKRDAFPLENRRPTLIDPTSDDPVQHLAFLPSNGQFRSIGSKGQPSIDVFGLNDTATPRKLPQARKEAFLKLQLLLEEYDRCARAGDTDGAHLARQTILDEPFPAVLGWLLEISQSPAAGAVMRPVIPSIVANHSVSSWV